MAEQVNEKPNPLSVIGAMLFDVGMGLQGKVGGAVEGVKKAHNKALLERENARLRQMGDMREQLKLVVDLSKSIGEETDPARRDEQMKLAGGLLAQNGMGESAKMLPGFLKLGKDARIAANRMALATYLRTLDTVLKERGASLTESGQLQMAPEQRFTLDEVEKTVLDPLPAGHPLKPDPELLALARSDDVAREMLEAAGIDVESADVRATREKAIAKAEGR